MSIANLSDAVEVQAKIADLLNAKGIDRRVAASPVLFVRPSTGGTQICSLQ